MAKPQQNATPHVRFKIARDDGEQPQASPTRPNERACDSETAALQGHVATCNDPMKKVRALFRCGARGSSFVAGDTKTCTAKVDGNKAKG